MRQALIDRATAAFGEELPKDGGVHRDPNGNVTEIVCLCGAQIAGPVPVDGALIRRVQDSGGTFLFGYYHNYQQVEIQFDDGGKHVSHGCRNCWQNCRETTPEKFYLRDLIGFDHLETLGHEPTPDTMWDMFLRRKPIGMRLVTVA